MRNNLHLDAETFPVLIEIPKGTANNKYEFDHKTKKMVLDFVFENLVWPFNYGEVVNTKGGDGDALDAAVYSSGPLKQGAVVNCVPFGTVHMLDRGEVDDKLLFVPLGDALEKKYRDMEDFSQKEKLSLKDFYAEIAKQKRKIIEIKEFLNKAETISLIKKSLI